jgi:hypothetical protein
MQISTRLGSSVHAKAFQINVTAYSKKLLLRDISTYTDDELVTLVDGIRERRLRVATTIGKMRVLSEEARRNKVEATLVKKSDAFFKKLVKIDEGIVELENRLAEVLAIRLQLGDTPDGIKSDLVERDGDSHSSEEH